MVPAMTTIPVFLFLARVAGILTIISLAACTASFPRIPATLIHDDVHTGGSLVRFNGAADRLVSGGWEGRVVLWSLPEGARLRSWQAHAGSVNGASFMQHDERLLTAGYDGRLAQWSLQGELLLERASPSPVTAMALSETRERVVTGHADGQLRIWSLPSLVMLDQLPILAHPVKAVALNEVDGSMAASSEGGEVVLVEADGKWRSLPAGPSDTWTLDFAPDGHILMGAGWFRLHRWRLPDGELTLLPTEHHGIIKSLHYSVDGRALVSISRQTDSAVNFLDPETGATLRRFQRHALCGGDVRLSGNGAFLASTSDDASVRIWDLRYSN